LSYSSTSLDCNLAERESVSVLVADDQPVVLAGLVSFLSRRPHIKVVCQARNGREAVEQFVALRPDVGMFELHMPVMDGVEAATAILSNVPLAQLLIFTSRASEEDVYRAVRAGILGCMLKNATEEELLQGIYTVASGRNWMPPLLAAKLARRIVERELTARETQVLGAITNGKSNKEIGVVLNISEATVKVHVTQHSPADPHFDFLCRSTAPRHWAGARAIAGWQRPPAGMLDS